MCVGWKLVMSERSMPAAVRREFPLVHFPKFTVVREIMSLVRTTTVNKMAFSAVTSLLNELINTNEWRKLTRYYSYQIQARLAGQQQRGRTQILGISQIGYLGFKSDLFTR